MQVTAPPLLADACLAAWQERPAPAARLSTEPTSAVLIAAGCFSTAVSRPGGPDGAADLGECSAESWATRGTPSRTCLALPGCA